MPSQLFPISPDDDDLTLAATLRARLPGHSWNQVRRLIAARRVRINGDLCLDPARRLKAGATVELLPSPAPKPAAEDTVRIAYLDEHLVVVEKPAGLCTVRHPAERDWPARRKALTPTLEDLVPRIIAAKKSSAGSLARRLRCVHRLDKETSGLVVFARTVEAERGLGRQFKAHTVLRRYLAIVMGHIDSQRIETHLVRDRGDGRRGSTTLPGVGKVAITHVEVIERLPAATLVACRLETGRTHQIRIHLAEKGHPVLGEKVYHRVSSENEAPRLALHAAELGLVHPITAEYLHWEAPLPRDLAALLKKK